MEWAHFKKREVEHVKLSLEDMKMGNNYLPPACAAFLKSCTPAQSAQQGLDWQHHLSQHSSLPTCSFRPKSLMRQHAAERSPWPARGRVGGSQASWTSSSAAGTASKRCTHGFNKSVRANLCFTYSQTIMYANSIAFSVVHPSLVQRAIQLGTRPCT